MSYIANRSRTQNTIRNIIMGFSARAVAVLLPFVTRSVLINELGADYAGLSSLFFSLLQILNVSELGISSAIIFSLYKPVADNNVREISEWLKVYRTLYLIIGIIILFFGSVLCPFVKLLIKGSYPNDVNIYFLFLIYLIDAVIGYLTFGYKRVVLTVYQRVYVINFIELLITLLKNALQIIVLLSFANFNMFVVVLPITTLISSITINLITNKLYPELNIVKGFSLARMSKLSKQLKGVAIGRISVVVKNALGNIVISATIGLVGSAIYANYYYIFTAVSGLLTIFLQAMSASVGNSLVTDTKEKNQDDHLKFDFYYEFMVAGGTIGLFCLYQPFVRLWVGNALMLPDFTCTLFCVYFYVNQLAQVRSVYSEAAGLWWDFRMITIAELFSNIAFMIVFGSIYGANGILIANIITAFFTSFIGITLVVYKKLFKCSSRRYYFQNFCYGVVTFIGCVLIGSICKRMPDKQIYDFLTKCLVCVATGSTYLFVLYLTNRKSRAYLIEGVDRIIGGKWRDFKNKKKN